MSKKAPQKKRSAKAKAAQPSKHASMGERTYSKGFLPFHKMLKRIKLPPRYEDGDLRNVNRMLAVAAALHQERVRLMSPADRKAHKATPCAACAFKVVLT